MLFFYLEKTTYFLLFLFGQKFIINYEKVKKQTI